MASGDLNGIYCAAEFLRPKAVVLFQPSDPCYDDQPDKTLVRLAALIGEFERRDLASDTGFFWRGRRIPVDFGNWTQIITSYGPRARPYVRVLLKFPEFRNCDNSGYLRQLGLVGGREAMEHFIHCLTATQQGDALRHARLGVDRWVGRVFSDDSERLAWWQAHKQESEEKWLRDSLPIVAAQCDVGKELADAILKTIVPDCPIKPAYLSSGLREKPAKPEAGASWQQWLRENQARLRYDNNTGSFRLAQRP